MALAKSMQMIIHKISRLMWTRKTRRQKMQ